MTKKQKTQARKIWEKVQDQMSNVEQLLEVMNDYYNERSDDWQDSEKGEQFQDEISYIEQFYNDIVNACDELNDNLNIEE